MLLRNRKCYTMAAGIFIILIIILLFLIYASNSNTSTMKLKDTDTLTQIAMLDKKYFFNSKNPDYLNTKKAIAVKGNDFTIYNDEVEYFTQRAILLGASDRIEARNYELQYLIRREVLFFKAKKCGFLAKNAEVNKYLKKQADVFERSSNSDDFSTYFNTIGLTYDEYWQMQFDTIKKDITITNYLTSIRKKLAKDNKLKYYSLDYVADLSCVDIEYKKFEELWKLKYEELLRQLTEEEHIRVLIKEWS